MKKSINVHAKSFLFVCLFIVTIVFPTIVFSICDVIDITSVARIHRIGSQDLCICKGDGGKVPTEGYFTWSTTSTQNTPSTDPTGNLVCQGCSGCYYPFPCELKQFCEDTNNFIPECEKVRNESSVCPPTELFIETGKRKRAPIRVLRKNSSQ